MRQTAPSWVSGAKTATTDFPLMNPPCGVFSRDGSAPGCGVAIGDFILEVAGLEAAGMLRLSDRTVLAQGRWNEAMALGPQALGGASAAACRPAGRGRSWAHGCCKISGAAAGARLHLPFRVAEYTDFYASIHHARILGSGTEPVPGQSLRRTILPTSARPMETARNWHSMPQKGVACPRCKCAAGRYGTGRYGAGRCGAGRSGEGRCGAGQLGGQHAAH